MKKKYFLITLLCVFFFVLGFFVHALFFPTVLFGTARKSTENIPEATGGMSLNKSLTLVRFERGVFTPQVVTVPKSYYLGIINTSDKELMTLTSSTPLLRTPRGYGLSEEHRVQLYDVGEYEVSSLQHPDSILKVVVK